MAKKIKIKLKLQIKAGQAAAGPPVGTTLGPHGLNIGEFVKRFNEATKDEGDNIIPVDLNIYEDRTFDFTLKTPPASDLLRKAAGIQKGSGSALTQKVGKVTKAQVRQIAEQKMNDLSAHDVEQAMKIIEGTAKNMGIEVTG